VAPSRIADHVGRVLGGRYRLLAPIGTGASAHVFLADDVTLRRRVAVKILHAALAEDESFLRRFRAEAQAAAALNHPNIMRVYDWGEDTDGPYLVLEYLGGGSLRDLLDSGRRLTPSQAAVVGLEAARALDYAHRRGFVHRDVKPANLLFDDEGRLCIADFGLARALAEAAWTEPTGAAVVGTVRYASPEQAKGASLDGRSDVYALALVLVEAVTGRVPFAADTTVGTLMARTNGDLEPPEKLGPLAPIIAKAGTVDPAKRVDAAGLAAGIDRVTIELPAPGPLPLAGADPIDATRVIDRDPTQLPQTKPGLFDADAAADPASDTQIGGPLAFEPSRRAGRRRRWPWILAVVALVAAVAGGAYAATELLVPSHPVPDISNKTLAEARTLLARDKLKVHIRAARDNENVAKDVILLQDPLPGQKLKEGRSVEVIVSRGPPPRAVPDLTGMDQAAAQAALEKAGFPPTFQPHFDENVPKGKVLDWAPKDGAKQPKGTPVTVTVSDGPEPRVVPDLKGKTFEQAQAALTPLRLTAVRVDVFNDTVPVGQVVSTSPGANAKAARDSKVTVNVSKGPELIAVPDVRGKNVIDATNILVAAGFEVNSTQGPSNKPVANTRPAPGSMQRRGTKIDLYTR
jgi:serine/threonine-protein kinase